MKKIMIKILTIAFGVVLMTLSSANVKAAEPSIPSEPTNYGAPISITTYLDEEGNEITERLYFYPTSNSSTRSKSGSGWYKNESQYTWVSGSTSTYYAKGYFTWADGNVSVTSPSGSISSVSGVSISNQSTTNGTGKYGYLFNNFAYVTFSCTATNSVGVKQNFSITIRISESGNAI